jgi:O-antigen ligase
LGHLAIHAWHQRRLLLAIGATTLALVFLGNVFYVAASRAMLIVLPFLMVLLARQRFGWRSGGALLAGIAVLSVAAWASSPYLRSRVDSIVKEVHRYEASDAKTSAGYRLEFWRKSVRIIASAPFFGHGTGSTATQFRRIADDSTDISAVVTNNPHNQTLSIAIQLGMIGTAVLFAMWLAHLMVFCGQALAAWLGLGIVVENIVASLFNSQLFFFTPGWTYVFGVGVFAGIVLGGHPAGERGLSRPSMGWRRAGNAANEESERAAPAGAE